MKPENEASEKCRTVRKEKRMPFDFKKEYKDLYGTGKEPVIVKVPKISYAAVRGQGDPNEEDLSLIHI